MYGFYHGEDMVALIELYGFYHGEEMVALRDCMVSTIVRRWWHSENCMVSTMLEPQFLIILAYLLATLNHITGIQIFNHGLVYRKFKAYFHVLFFKMSFIPLFVHSLKPLDIEVMKRLDKVCNVMPVISKADTLTIEERATFKNRVCGLVWYMYKRVDAWFEQGLKL